MDAGEGVTTRGALLPVPPFDYRVSRTGQSRPLFLRDRVLFLRCPDEGAEHGIVQCLQALENAPGRRQLLLGQTVHELVDSLPELLRI
jgi:hypothetical protein